MDVFKTKREFNNKYPSGLFVCSVCGGITPNPYKCSNCDGQSNNFVFSENSYEYLIEETGKTDLIFRPIEDFKEQK